MQKEPPWTPFQGLPLSLCLILSFLWSKWDVRVFTPRVKGLNLIGMTDQFPWRSRVSITPVNLIAYFTPWARCKSRGRECDRAQSETRTECKWKKELYMGCGHCCDLGDSTYAAIQTHGRQKSTSKCMLLFYNNLQFTAWRSALPFLGLRHERCYSRADPNEWASQPPTLGPPASSILCNEHPISGIMNQEVERKSVVWLAGFSNAVNFFTSDFVILVQFLTAQVRRLFGRWNSIFKLILKSTQHRSKACISKPRIVSTKMLVSHQTNA